jgi:hypothetical protein
LQFETDSKPEHDTAKWNVRMKTNYTAIVQQRGGLDGLRKYLVSTLRDEHVKSYLRIFRPHFKRL